MSSSSDPTKLATSTIPLFNGSNYKQWSDAIRAFLRFSGVWFLIQGYGSTIAQAQPGMARPTVGTTPTTAELAAQASWDEKNDKALGIIQLYVAQHLRHHVDDKTTALDAWNAIKDGYEKPGAVGAFVAFQKLFNAQLSDASPLGPQIDALLKAANQVNAAGIDVKEQLISLLIINCLPKSYQALSSTILATTPDIKLLKPSDVRPKIVEEEVRRQSNRLQVNRISKAPILEKKCAKCGRNNHMTENHWEKKPEASGSSSGQQQGQQQQGLSQGGGRRKKGKGKGNGQQNNTVAGVTVAPIEVVSLPNVPVVERESITVSLYASNAAQDQSKWMIDSGCTQHISPHKGDFFHYHEFTEPGYAKTADPKNSSDSWSRLGSNPA